MVSMGLADTDEGVRPPSSGDGRGRGSNARWISVMLETTSPCAPRKGRGEVGYAQPERMGGTTYGSEMDGAL